jgi:hypothetical protein
MAKFVYNGEAELVFPTLGVTVSKGDIFDAPDDFTAANVAPVKGKSKASEDTSAETPTDTAAPAASN